MTKERFTRVRVVTLPSYRGTHHYTIPCEDGLFYKFADASASWGTFMRENPEVDYTYEETSSGGYVITNREAVSGWSKKVTQKFSELFSEYEDYKVEDGLYNADLYIKL